MPPDVMRETPPIRRTEIDGVPTFWVERDGPCPYGRMKEWERFRREVEIVQGRLTTPWNWHKDPAAYYNELRKAMADEIGGVPGSVQSV